MSKFVATQHPTCNIANTHTKLGRLTFSQNLIFKKKSEWAKAGLVGLLKQLIFFSPYLHNDISTQIPDQKDILKQSTFNIYTYLVHYIRGNRSEKNPTDKYNVSTLTCMVFSSMNSGTCFVCNLGGKSVDGASADNFRVSPMAFSSSETTRDNSWFRSFPMSAVNKNNHVHEPPDTNTCLFHCCMTCFLP